MRCYLMYLPFVTRDKNGGYFWDESSHPHRGRVSIGDFVIGGVYMRDVVRIFVFFSFLSILDTLSLVHWSCDYLVIANIVLFFYIYIYIYLMMLLSHFTYLSMWCCCCCFLSLSLSLFLSLYTHISYLMYAILYFCFTLRCLNKFCLKCFKNTSCQSLFAINFLLAKFFKSLCKDRFYCIQ